MIQRSVRDFDDAYSNGPHLPRGDAWPSAWVEPAAAFRDQMTATGRADLDISYGPGDRQRLDLFRPMGEPRGLVVYVHGGFWKALDKSYWSHLAGGALNRGYAVAIPSYTLCPQARIAAITQEIGSAITSAAGTVSGPLVLVGHSAGGHLVTRMASLTSPLPAAVRSRLRHVVSLSGLHDLRPLIRTAMNGTLRLDDAEAFAESPALLAPLDGLRLTCWVGGAERAEFLRQSALLANVWLGLGATTANVVEPDRHHFDVVDGLADRDHELTRTLLS